MGKDKQKKETHVKEGKFCNSTTYTTQSTLEH